MGSFYIKLDIDLPVYKVKTFRFKSAIFWAKLS